VYTINATRKLLTRVGGAAEPIDEPTTSLGNRYANAVFWQPQVAVLVNERTLLPLFLPLAPARTLGVRIPDSLSELLALVGIGEAFIRHESAEMAAYQYSPTASRSVLASMNDFVRQASRIRWRPDVSDLLSLSLELAHTPCRIMQEHATWPDREVHGVEASWLAVRSLG
jgi:hypothetical protein